MDCKTSVCGLLQPLGGLFGRMTTFRAEPDEPRLMTRVVDLGDVRQVWGRLTGNAGHPNGRLISGAGVGLDTDDALLPALGEGLERYCSCIFTKEQFITASGQELGNEAIDLDCIPRCSNAELSSQSCPITAPDKHLPIRWVRAVSLLDGSRKYLPAVMVYLYAGVRGPGERFWLPITTGCAGHVSFERALVSAICEVVERDAISILWLQKLGLPKIEVDVLLPALAPYWERYQRGTRDLEYVFFDASTDIGIPTVYGLQVSRENKRLTTLVSCSAALQPAEAIAKVMRDMAACRIAFRTPRYSPEKPEECRTVFDGASYMSRAERETAFNFLLASERKRPLSTMTGLNAASDKEALQLLINMLRSKGVDAYAVDLTTDEALRVGVRVVRVVIPVLQPFSFHYLARYLGHPRLYEAPQAMGYLSHKEAELNPWPQPFA